MPQIKSFCGPAFTPVGDKRVTDCDDLYDSAGDFDVLYPAIADRVLSAARSGGTVVFAVPGHPRVGEKSVPLIEDGARAALANLQAVYAILSRIRPYAKGA